MFHPDPPFVRNPYNYHPGQASDESGLSCPEPTLTVQSERDDADINVLVKRFGITGVMPQVQDLPNFGDFTGISDYQSALNAIMSADDAFMQLPADMRSKFNNDPHELLSFLDDANNRQAAIDLGLVPSSAEPVQSPTKSDAQSST